MGSPFVDYGWAANRLNRSKRQVHHYINDGLLTKVRHEGKPYLRREEVEQLRIELESGRRTVTRKTVLELELRVKRLEDEMNTVRHILEIRDQPLRPSTTEARGLLAAAAESLGRGKWGFEEISLWASQFERMDEETLDVFARALPGEEKPWMSIYRLCVAHEDHLSGLSGIESEALRKKLNRCRRRLRSSVLMWIELGRGSVDETVFNLVDSPQEKVVRRLTSG